MLLVVPQELFCQPVVRSNRQPRAADMRLIFMSDNQCARIDADHPVIEISVMIRAENDHVRLNIGSIVRRTGRFQMVTFRVTSILALLSSVATHLAGVRITAFERLRHLCVSNDSTPN